MRNLLKDYFAFSSKDIRAIYVLLVILVILLALQKLPAHLFKSSQPDFSGFEQKVLLLENARRAMMAEEINRAETKKAAYGQASYSKIPRQLTPFPFDPNQITEQEWLRLGLSEKQVRGIMNYVTKGGKFKSKDDVKKLYTISPAEYEILEPFIIIAPQYAQTQNAIANYSKNVPKSNEMTLIDINQADTLALLSVKGIGAVFARRIIKYREQLGGIHSSEQLLEVFGMDSTRYELIRNSFVFEEKKIRKLNLNKASVEEMSRHPYVDFYLAKSIVDKRIRAGRLHSVEEIANIPLMHQARFQKLLPYLITE